MGSEGRRSSAYRRLSAEFKTGRYPCHICGLRPGVTVDHVPPLSSFAHHSLWRGRWLPACKPCQSRQGGALAAERTAARRRWKF